jgi:hypothetical protein
MTRTLLEKEKRLLRVLYDLSQVYIEVTPTMVSDAMGFTCCARKNLEAQKYLTIRHVSRGRAILKLTKAGAELAKTLEKASFLGRGSIRKNKVSPAYLINDPTPIGGPDYREEPWRGHKKKFRYEDADIRFEILNPYMPDKELHLMGASFANLCASE